MEYKCNCSSAVQLWCSYLIFNYFQQDNLEENIVLYYILDIPLYLSSSYTTSYFTNLNFAQKTYGELKYGVLL